jgi:hypothetical protein
MRSSKKTHLRSARARLPPRVCALRAPAASPRTSSCSLELAANGRPHTRLMLTSPSLHLLVPACDSPGRLARPGPRVRVPVFSLPWLCRGLGGE